jgi:hypothetical protein
MVGKVVNLNRYRKQKAKADRKQQADVNRRLHGRTKAERAREELQKKQLTRGLEGAKLERPAEPEPSPDELKESVAAEPSEDE